jgi:hypothetical protein
MRLRRRGWGVRKMRESPEAGRKPLSGAAEDEIEITPAMIEAGVRAYRDRGSYFMSERDIVEDIYFKMSEAKRDKSDLIASSMDGK